MKPTSGGPAASTLRRGRAGALGVLFTEALSYAFADPAAVPAWPYVSDCEP